MAVNELVGPALSMSNSVFSYFSPSKSPFYGIVAFGTAALMLSCQEIDDPQWRAIAIPVWLVLALVLFLAIADRRLPASDLTPTGDAAADAKAEDRQHQDQLRFARSFGVSSALLALVLTAQKVSGYDVGFWINYAFCLTQVGVFLVYAWARLARPEPSPVNFVQFTLITSSFLIGGCYGLAKYVELGGEDPTDMAAALRFLYASTGAYSLWVICILQWFKHLATLVRVVRTP